MWLCPQLQLGGYGEHGSKAHHLGPFSPIKSMQLRARCEFLFLVAHTIYFLGLFVMRCVVKSSL
jgi:WD40 repeat protein